MVSGIDSNYFDLSSIKQDLELLETSDGKISTGVKETLSPDLTYFLDNLGDSTDVDLTLEEVEQMMESQAAKQPKVDPQMDLDLDMDDIPDSGSFR